MASTWVEQAAALAGALGLGGILKGGLDWWLKRQAAERREPADLTRAAADFQEALTEGGKELLDEFRREFRFLRGRVADLQREVDEAKQEASKAAAAHVVCEARVLELSAEVDRLLAQNPPATYAPRPIPGVSPPRSNPEEEA